MRLSQWMLALIALMTGGCVLPCSPGACSTSGEPRFVSPASRFFSTEKLIPQHTVCNSAGGNCQPRPYFTFSKYLPLVDRWTSTKTARRCADRHLLRQQFQCRKWISKHYKAGFRDAFTDIANGENGEVPAVPPPKYWNTHYRTERGKRCVELYFDGYRAGAALAATELTTMKTIGASYDWSIEKPRSPCAAPGRCNNGIGSQHASYLSGPGTLPNGGYSIGVPGQPTSVPMGQPHPGCQSCQSGAPTPFAGHSDQPAVIPLNPTTSGQANPSSPFNPSPGDYGSGSDPDPGFHQPHDQYQDSAGPYGVAPQRPQPQQPDPGQHSQNLMPGLPAPGYTSPGGTRLNLPFPQDHQSPPNSDFLPNIRPPGNNSRRANGPLTPGFSGRPPGQVLPGRLGPPDSFKSDPPVWQYPQPQR